MALHHHVYLYSEGEARNQLWLAPFLSALGTAPYPTLFGFIAIGSLVPFDVMVFAAADPALLGQLIMLPNMIARKTKFIKVVPTIRVLTLFSIV